MPAFEHEASAAQPVPINALRRWLYGNWALLFSHPDDFAAYGFEEDRWILHVREAFAATGVRPLALASRTTRHSAGWVLQVGGCSTDVEPESLRRYPLARDSHEYALATAVCSAKTRFVMFLDDTLRLRRTYVYTAHDRLPSPIDLAGVAERQRLGERRRVAEAAARAHAQRCAQPDTLAYLPRWRPVCHPVVTEQ
ncbi:MAG: hypothetical protein DIU71_14495 [Proteobacteria bacterium]|nr:MAG: hypothetical protein DIU71_14495 [Pseudomonadota bacterium]